MHVKIIGLGWYGLPLAKELIKNGFRISGTTRTPEKKAEIEKLGIEVELLSYPARPGLDANIVVLNIPPFEEELAWFQSWKWSENVWPIFISSTSVYPKPDSKNAQLLYDQEEWIKKSFNKWTILRFGGLISESRHPGKHLSGKKFLKGANWPVNLIHLNDTVGTTLSVIQKNISQKIVHVVSDEHPTRKEYYSKYCLDHGLNPPEFDPGDLSTGKIVPNEELKAFYTPKTKL